MPSHTSHRTRDIVPQSLPEENLNLRDASIVTILVRQGDPGKETPKIQAIKRENITGAEATAGISVPAVATGPALSKFLLYENLICEASPVLKATFQGHFAEAGSKTMTIDNLDVDMIDQFVKWLYRGKMLLVKPDTKDAEQSWYLNMVYLAVVADVWRVEGLEDDVIDALVKCVNHFVMPPGWNVLHSVYANTCKLSKLRRWVAAWYTEAIDFGWYKQGSARGELARNPEFASDIAMAFGRQLTHPRSKSFFRMIREERNAPVDLEGESGAG